MGLFGPSKELCAQCRENKTRRRDKNERPICAECEIRLAMDAEDVIECPIDNTLMKKEQVGDTDFIIDREKGWIHATDPRAYSFDLHECVRVCKA